MTDLDTTSDLEKTPDSAPATPDTADAGSTSVDNLASDQTAGTSADVGAAVAANPPEDGQQDSFTGGAETKTVAAPAVPQYGEKQYKEVQGWATKLSQQNAELKAQLNRLQSQVQEREQAAKQATTEPWDPEDSRHANFLKLVERADYYDELMRGETDPAIVQKLQDKQLKLLGNDGIDQLQRWQQAVRAQERERRLNPRAFYQKLIRQEAQPVVRETLQSTNDTYQRQVQAVNDVQQWLQNKEIATDDNKKALISYMEKGMPFNVAQTIVERDHYRNQVSAAQKASASAGEKERLLQGNAAGAVSRNPNASKQVDVPKFFKDKGVTSSRQKIDALFDLDHQGLL